MQSRELELFNSNTHVADVEATPGKCILVMRKIKSCPTPYAKESEWVQ